MAEWYGGQMASVVPLTDGRVTLALVGGKGANLAKLAQAGFPVPGGFLITTQAYQEFVQTNHLAQAIQTTLQGAQLAPGEILVCPGTDPAWTLLFLAAGGLVMEVGGLMTHGSVVVAREYGIPAVVGVYEATTRLKTGQRIRVDGSSGELMLVNGSGASVLA